MATLMVRERSRRRISAGRYEYHIAYRARGPLHCIGVPVRASKTGVQLFFLNGPFRRIQSLGHNGRPNDLLLSAASVI